MNPPILEYTSPLRVNQPAEMRTQCDLHNDEIVIIDPAKGVHSILGTLVGLIVIGVLLHFALIQRMITTGIRDPGFFAVAVICLGLFYLGWRQMCQARQSKRITVNRELLTFDTGDLLRQWPVGEIAQIQAHVRGIGVDMKSIGDLRLIPRTGHAETLLRDLPAAELKWLAMTLREFLSLPIDGSKPAPRVE